MATVLLFLSLVYSVPLTFYEFIWRNIDFMFSFISFKSMSRSKNFKKSLLMLPNNLDNTSKELATNGNWVAKEKHDILKVKYTFLKKLFKVYDSSINRLMVNQLETLCNENTLNKNKSVWQFNNSHLLLKKRESTPLAKEVNKTALKNINTEHLKSYDKDEGSFGSSTSKKTLDKCSLGPIIVDAIGFSENESDLKQSRNSFVKYPTDEYNTYDEDFGLIQRPNIQSSVENIFINGAKISMQEEIFPELFDMRFIKHEWINEDKECQVRYKEILEARTKCKKRPFIKCFKSILRSVKSDCDSVKRTSNNNNGIKEISEISQKHKEINSNLRRNFSLPLYKKHFRRRRRKLEVNNNEIKVKCYPRNCISKTGCLRNDGVTGESPNPHKLRSKMNYKTCNYGKNPKKLHKYYPESVVSEIKSSRKEEREIKNIDMANNRKLEPKEFCCRYCGCAYRSKNGRDLHEHLQHSFTKLKDKLAGNNATDGTDKNLVIGEDLSREDDKLKPRLSIKCETDTRLNVEDERAKSPVRNGGNRLKSSQRRCVICGEVFRHREGLSIHMELLHHVPTVHRCGFCSLYFDDVERLEAHFNKYHRRDCLQDIISRTSKENWRKSKRF